MALHVTAKGITVVLKITGCYSKEGRGKFRNNILTWYSTEGSFADTKPDRRKCNSCEKWLQSMQHFGNIAE